MKRKSLSPEQAFKAMSVFLEDYFNRMQGEAALADVLSDIQINPGDGRTMDPVAWDDWLSAVGHVLEDAATDAATGSKTR